MRRVIVQYKVKKDRVEEHEALVRAVFAELAKTKPDGIEYGAFKQPDGVSFVHVAFVSAKENPLQSLAAFQAFTANIKDRCDVMPATIDVSEVGVYGF